MLREIRIRHGIKRQKLAETAMLSRTTLEKAEKGIVVSDVSASRISSAISKLSGQTYTIKDLGIRTREENDGNSQVC